MLAYAIGYFSIGYYLTKGVFNLFYSLFKWLKTFKKGSARDETSTSNKGMPEPYGAYGVPDPENKDKEP